LDKFISRVLEVTYGTIRSASNSRRLSYQGFEEDYKKYIEWLKNLPIYIKYGIITNEDGELEALSALQFPEMEIFQQENIEWYINLI